MYNKIKGLTGKSPVELIQEFRMEKATYYLKSGQFSVSETSYKVGFSDPGYFSRSFKKHFGITPAEYIKQNKNAGTDEEARGPQGSHPGHHGRRGLTDDWPPPDRKES